MNYERVDELLRDKGMSRRQLAASIGIAPGKLANWFCRRTKHVPTKQIKAIADVLGVPWYTLILIDDEEEIPNIIQTIVSGHDELVTGYSDSQLIADFHSLSIPSQRYIIQEIQELKEADKGNDREGSE